jgi:catalase
VLDRVVDNFFAETEQVAFCTQNVVPGIDFTNDPLLQGATSPTSTRSSSGSAARTSRTCPINAPRCPVANFQQDGHMAMRTRGRANYEPNSWGERRRPARESRRPGSAVPERRRRAEARVRPETFADHYSQARQFYISQTAIEQKHIGDALVFELSKVERPSVLFDAVAVVLATDHAEEIAALPGAKDFVSDAHAHQKLVAYTDGAAALFAAAAVDHESGPGYQRLDGSRKTADEFIQTCRQVRAWDRAVG